MMIIGKIDTERIVLNGDLPEVNVLVANACMIPILKKRGPSNYFSQYKAPANIRNPAFEAFYKRLVFEKPNSAMLFSFGATYVSTDFIDEKIPLTYYFDGSYANLGVDLSEVDHFFYATSIVRCFPSAKMAQIKAFG